MTKKGSALAPDGGMVRKRIIDTYTRELGSLPAKERIHFIRRAYRLTGQAQYVEMMEAWASSHTIPAIRRRAAILEEVAAGATDFPSVSFRASRNPRVAARNRFLEANPKIQFFRRYLMDLFQAQSLGIDQSVLRDDWPGYIATLKRFDFTEVFLDDEVIEKVSSFAVNCVVFLDFLGVDHELAEKFVDRIRDFYLTEELELVRELPPREYTSFIYNLTHIVIAYSGFYQRWVPGHAWIADVLSRHAQQIIDVCSADVQAESGVALRLLREEPRPHAIELLRSNLLQSYDTDRALQPEFLARREHTNALMMLLFSDNSSWYAGAGWLPMTERASRQEPGTAEELSFEDGASYGLEVDASVPPERPDDPRSTTRPTNVRRVPNPEWPSHFQPDVVREGFGYRLSSYSLLLEAWRRGLTVTLLAPSVRRFRVTDESGRSVDFVGSRPTPFKNMIVRDKHKTNELVAASGLPTPESVLIKPASTSASQLAEIAAGLGYPVVLKPRDGARGAGVFSNISDERTLLKRYEQLLEFSGSDPLVMETHVPGDDYRVLIYGDQYIAACHRVPANIVGDGVHSVAELIDQKNKIRRVNPFLSTGLIRTDDELNDNLRRLNLSLASTPAEGEVIQLKNAANASAGGDVIDVTDSLPSDIRDAAIQAVQVIPGLECGGVDVLFDSETGRYSILEINGLPQIGVNMYPTQGKGQDVPKKVLDLLFPDSPRAVDESRAMLAVSVEPALAVLRSGHASAVDLPPIPEHGYSSRYIFDLEVPLDLTRSQQGRVLRLIRQHELSGFIQTNSTPHRIMIAGAEAGIAKFRQDFHTLTGVNTMNRRRWDGPVRSGFVF